MSIKMVYAFFHLESHKTHIYMRFLQLINLNFTLVLRVIACSLLVVDENPEQAQCSQRRNQSHAILYLTVIEFGNHHRFFMQLHRKNIMNYQLFSLSIYMIKIESKVEAFKINVDAVNLKKRFPFPAYT